MKTKNFKKLLSNLFIVIITFSITFETYAAPPAVVIKNALPGSTQPGVLSKTLMSEEPKTPRARPSVKAPQEEPSSLGPEATRIKFVLHKIILEGNHVYSNQQIEALYKNKLNTEISVAELQNIVQDITNFYRNNGYILSRAVLVPQHVDNGVVRVRILEGYIDQVHVIGVPKGSRKLVQAYGDKIAHSRPLQLKTMEHYLRLANEIPGLVVKAVLEPSKAETGASDLNLSAEQQTLSGYFSFDNYGTRYIGPHQDTLSASLNSIFLPGDSTSATYLTTTRPKELKFYDISYRAFAGSDGLHMTVGKNDSKTQPGLELAPLDVNGVATTYYFLVEYPYLRSRASNLTFDAGFNYLDSEVSSFSTTLYNDHLRPIKIGATYDFADRFNGGNLIGAHIEKGLNILGASNNPNSTTTSRFGADGIYTRFILQAIHSQPFLSRYSVFLAANGQYSFSPLLASEQFTFGGSQMGRGYDPAEIIGDRGMGGTIELRSHYAPGYFLLNTIDPYVFYDAGVIWNIKNVIGISQKQSITSIGAGTRFTLNKYLNGNLMIAQPLTKVVSAEEVVGKGRLPRVFFSIVASV